MNSDFEVFVGDDPDSDYFWAEIQYKGEAVAVVTEADNDEDMTVQLLGPQNAQSWRFKLADFEEALQWARQRLKDLGLRPQAER